MRLPDYIAVLRVDRFDLFKIKPGKAVITRPKPGVTWKFEVDLVDSWPKDQCELATEWDLNICYTDNVESYYYVKD